MASFRQIVGFVLSTSTHAGNEESELVTGHNHSHLISSDFLSSVADLKRSFCYYIYGVMLVVILLLLRLNVKSERQIVGH